MPFQPAPGTIGVVIHGLLSGQLTNNDLYFFQNGADPTVGDCSAIAQLVRGWYDDMVATFICDNWLGVKVVAKNLFVNGGAKAVVAMTGVQGGVTTESVPNNCAAVISFDTGQSGRSSHGRNYIPGVPNAEVDVNTISGSFAANMIAAYQALLPGGTYDPTPYSWAVLSRQSGGIVLASAIAVPTLNVYFNDTTIDSQRRRLPGRGR